MRAAILCCCCALSASPAAAQQIRGRIMQSGSATPVTEATITASALAAPRTVDAVSDSAGRFALSLPFAGVWRLRIEHIAYATVTADSIAVAPAEQVEVEVTLAPDVIPLDPLIVRSRQRGSLGRLREFYDRLDRRGLSGNGTFLTREDFEQHPGLLLTGYLAMVPGVTIVPDGPYTAVTMRGTTGRCRPAIYLDGVEVGGDFGSMIDNLAHPETLEGVEVYRSAVFAPALYGRHNCGVLLLWTRSGDGGRPFSWKRMLIGVGGFLGLILLLRGV